MVYDSGFEIDLAHGLKIFLCVRCCLRGRLGFVHSLHERPKSVWYIQGIVYDVPFRDY